MSEANGKRKTHQKERATDEQQPGEISLSVEGEGDGAGRRGGRRSAEQSQRRAASRRRALEPVRAPGEG